MKNIQFLLSYAWGKCKPAFFTVALKNIFIGILPLIGIVGLGTVVDALEKQRPLREVLWAIGIYLLVNCAVSLLKIVLTFLDNIVLRKASDITQTDYMRDCVFINYHYVEDKSILNLKKKSMGANPVWFLKDFFGLLTYLVQFAGIAYLFTILSPWFLLLIFCTCALSVWIDFQKKKVDVEYNNAQAEDDRKLSYVYRTMWDYTYAKEVRIHSAAQFLQKKYDAVLKNLLFLEASLKKKKLRMNLAVAGIAVAQTIIMYAFFPSR